ncbi:TraR/DksA family transcriptional regulator [Amphritea balenae]|uniref:TraR/DksA family transcriptional regulator n=1 Tax=Amphritea balenae TaxID=452629 RepID=A0A3P1SV42_9GAMM|nr:TraR/DksA C4-type zinc finger protein [Amphritea balenae]RRD01087.1 TraR/DksA family transcriptional regulator [Amphritea balenae]GGK60066.1 molecular chaperone DnaK [Amphritea balenae]
MKADQLQICHQALQTLKRELVQEIEDLQESAQPVQLDQQTFGRVSRGEALQQQEMAQAALELCRARLSEVLHAEQKFSEDEYGYCESCDELIAQPRIEARPDSRFCLKCQAATELRD